MDPKHVHEQLNRLQSEIDDLPVESGERAKLHALVEDIDRELGSGPSEPPPAVPTSRTRPSTPSTPKTTWDPRSGCATTSDASSP